MQYALVGGMRAEATPRARGVCPVCENEVLARCGEVNTWHWAHRSRIDCDVWSEGESLWHITWKRRFPRQWREVTIGRHRADVASPRGVIELQASGISPEEVVERERFYGCMVWVVDASHFRLHVRDRGSYVTFRWKHPRKTWWHATKPLYFDLGTHLLKIHRLHQNLPCGGSGTLVSYAEFVNTFSRAKAGNQLCEDCRRSLPKRQLIETGTHEYYTLDLDPTTLLCIECYEARCDERTPNDASLFDCYTPVAFAL